MKDNKKNPKETSNIPDVKNKIYTEAELLHAVKYACEYQKATDYQTALRLFHALSK